MASVNSPSHPDPVRLRRAIKAKALALGLDAGKTDAARSFFDPALRNQSTAAVADTELPQHVSELYNRLLQYRQA